MLSGWVGKGAVKSDQSFWWLNCFCKRDQTINRSLTRWNSQTSNSSGHLFPFMMVVWGRECWPRSHFRLLGFCGEYPAGVMSFVIVHCWSLVCIIIIIIIIIIKHVLIKVTLSCQRHCRGTAQWLTSKKNRQKCW